MSCDAFALANEGVRGLKPYQPGKPVEELERELGLARIVKLASNESPLGPGPRAIAGARAAIEELARYPDGAGTRLKAALGARLGVAEPCITLGNGSNDVLELVARVFLAPEHEVVFSEHAFAVYPIVTRAIGARAVVTPARDWGHDLEAMAKAITPRTRLVFIADPNNPTGTWNARAELEAFLGALPDHVIAVVDQAYAEYVDEPGYPDCIPWVARHDNLVVTRTFSKAYGLAALRVGYAVSSAAIAELMNRVRQPFNVNSIALDAAAAALGDEAHLARSREVNRAGMAQLLGGLEALGLPWIPSVANFVSFELPVAGTTVFQALLHEGVIVRPLDAYGMPRHLRVTVGLEEENRFFLEALARVLDNVSAA
ncbi:MAG: histidinol-phosphate transaminase [Gammaproteobacteria bacterium]|nr:histidinol-phosphate transaminase [Gammaproteobacteria bacterium]